jgi:ribonuclease T2
MIFPTLIIFTATVATCFAAGTDTLYVLAYSWEAEFCYGTSYPGCSDPEDYWQTHFTLHGLWPQYVTSGYPQSCTTEAFDPKTADSIGMDTMIEYWPNVQEAEGSSSYDDFWSHEWSKHGTCSGLQQVDYFNTTINLIKSYGTPSIVSSNVGKSVSASSLRTAFGGPTYVALQCNGGQYLVGKRVIAGHTILLSSLYRSVYLLGTVRRASHGADRVSLRRSAGGHLQLLLGGHSGIQVTKLWNLWSFRLDKKLLRPADGWETATRARAQRYSCKYKIET